MTSREEFEEWYAEDNCLDAGQAAFWLSKEICGGYTYRDPEAAWHVWQAARATSSLCPGRAECVSCCCPAVEQTAGYTAVDMNTAAADGYRDGKANLKLPDRKYEPNGVGDYNYDDGHAIGWNDCLDAIKELNEGQPVLPFKIGPCANKRCSAKSREISPYCEKCEPDL